MSAPRWAARLARLPLRFIPRGVVVTAPAGPLRGMQWIPESMPHGAWLGCLERRQLEAFVSRLERGMTVWDVGANVGLYSLPSARAVGPDGAVYAFEPVARNVTYLRRHAALNALENIHVVQAAVGDRTRTVRMAPGASPSEARVAGDGKWEVAAVALDEWRRESGSPLPDLMKIDVEGAEDAVLAGSMETLRAAPSVTVFLSLHGETQRAACRSALESLHFQISSLLPDLSVERASEWLAERR